MTAKSTLRHPWLATQLAAGPVERAYRCFVMHHNDSQWLHHMGKVWNPFAPPEQPGEVDRDQYVFGFEYGPKRPRYTCRATTVFSTSGVACADLEAVEAMALGRIFETCEVMPRPGDIWEINRASSAVAKSSRRGMGNIVLAHPETLTRLYDGAPPDVRPIFSPRAEEPEEIAGWTRPFEGPYDRGTRGITFWTKPVMPENKMIVLYHGRTNQCDAAYFALGHETAPYFYECKESYLYPAHYYARVVEFI